MHCTPTPLSLTLNCRAKFETRLGNDVDDGVVKISGLPKVITSAANPFVKHCLKLRLSSSYRHVHGSVVVVGTTPIRCVFYIFKLSIRL